MSAAFWGGITCGFVISLIIIVLIWIYDDNSHIHQWKALTDYNITKNGNIVEIGIIYRCETCGKLKKESIKIK